MAPAPRAPAALAEQTIRRHAAMAAACGLFPAPLIDMALVTGVQLNLLRRLAERYGVPFSEELGRSLLAAIVGTSAPFTTASLLKVVPVLGTLVGKLLVPAFAGASTYAVGRVFVQHFESGGTFLTLNPDAVRTHYKEQFASEAQRRAEQRRRP